MSALQVVDNDLVADRDEGLIQAVTAFASSLEQAQPRFPFVRARGSVLGFPVFLLTNRIGKISARPRNKDRNNFTLPEGVCSVLSFPAAGSRRSIGAVLDAAANSERSISILARASSSVRSGSANLALSCANSC